MNRILLLIRHEENGRLLVGALAAHGHQVVRPETPEASGARGTPEAPASSLLAGTYDLCILDAYALDALAAQIRARREAEAPLFLPFLLVSPRHEPATVTRYLPETVDEWLSTPVQRVELQARVEMLLRVRHLSRQAADKARLEGVLLAARTLEHEVSNKLVATAGYTERLAASAGLSPQMRERAARAHQNAKEAAAIIRRVLSLTESAGTGDRPGLPTTDWGETGGTTIDLSAA